MWNSLFVIFYLGYVLNWSEISSALSIPFQRRQDEPRTLYNIGVGKGDITSAIVEYDFMGYAALAQKGTGIRQRIFSRAFIIASLSKQEDRFVYVICDLAMGDTAVRKGVIEGLEQLYPGVYGENIALGKVTK